MDVRTLYQYFTKLWLRDSKDDIKGPHLSFFGEAPIAFHTALCTIIGYLETELTVCLYFVDATLKSSEQGNKSAEKINPFTETDFVCGNHNSVLNIFQGISLARSSKHC